MLKHIAHTGSALAVAAGLLYAPQADARFVFPTNHPDLEWYTIDTEHFSVHYPMSRKEEGNPHYLETQQSARLTARVAEEMWPTICGHYNYYLKERVHITILNQSDYLEGFTVPPWDWIEVSVNPGAYFYRQRGRMEWLSDVLYHEFGHVVSLKANAHLAEGTQGVLIGGLYQDTLNDVDTGVEFFILDADPFSWSEGSAEGASEMAWGNWWTSARDQTLRNSVLEDEGLRLLSFRQQQTRAQSFNWNDGERAYQMGYAFNIYLRQRFGEDAYMRFAIEAGKRWRPNWFSVVEDVLGVDAETLYNDWVEYMNERYGEQYEAIKAEGEVVGRELAMAPVDWDYTTPGARDEWFDGITKRRRKMEVLDDRHASGTWQIEPRYDAELGIFGQVNRSTVVLNKYPVDRMEAFTGQFPSNPGAADEMARFSDVMAGNFMHGWDFVPGKYQVVVTGREDLVRGGFAQMSGLHWDADGYEWKQLWVQDIVQREEKDHGVEYDTWTKKQRFKKYAVVEKGAARPIPNTLRGTDPSVRPDGEKVAFLQYADGTTNLATVNLDGSDKKHLTEFTDGTWMQAPKWSPDGKKIAVAVFRNYRQNLYIFDAETGGFEAITWDAWEEQDAHWSADGKTIFFSADPTGVYNIFAYDLESRAVEQITNVIGGAMCPLITPEGNLVYINNTAYGYKVYGVSKADFLNKDVTALFNTQPDAAEVKANWAFSEDLSEYEALTHPYRWSKALMPPSAVPIFRLENDSRTNVGLQGGFQVFMQDYVENHGGWLYVLIGEDLLFLGGYFNQMWYPNFNLMAYHYEVKYDYGYFLDEDDDPLTTDDQSTWEGKNQQYANIVWATMDLPWNDYWYTDLYGMFLEYGFRTTSENKFSPYQYGWETGLTVNWSNLSYWDGRSANPRAGRNVELTLAHAFTDVVYEPYGGVAPDDGELMDSYHYNKAELRWVRMFDIPTFGAGFMKKARAAGHRIQLDSRFGWVDRNVNYNDEWRAGGQHPYYWGNNSLRPNTQFSGYPSYSLLGETMIMGNIAYRFPIARNIKKGIGPIFVDALHGQVMGGAGNLWSFRPPDDESLYWRNAWDERIANDPDDIYREVPFKDVAYKNAPTDKLDRCYEGVGQAADCSFFDTLLYDVGAELRVTASMFNSAYWDSFVRVAYGFNEIRGVGDVDGDDIYDTSESAIGDELSNETHPAGFRVYIGLGTGW